MRILVVDDHEASAAMLEMAIEDLGDEVRACHDGHAALTLAHAFDPDVMLLDLGLPGMDGYQVCQALREDPRHAGMKIIAVTGHGEPEHKRQSAAAGFDLHMVKPVDMEVLSDMLDLLRHGLRKGRER